MDIAELILKYIDVLIWPAVVLFVLVSYREVILSLLPRSTIKFQFSGVTVETTLSDFKYTIEENLRGAQLSSKHWEWLRRLEKEELVPYRSEYYNDRSPLRNSGLIWEHPIGWLSNAEKVSISPLGRLLLSAWEKDWGTQTDPKEN